MEAEAKEILRATYEAYKPMAVLALFSGGGDSLCATHLAVKTTLAAGLRTGRGIQYPRPLRGRVRCRAVQARWRRVHH